MEAQAAAADRAAAAPLPAVQMDVEMTNELHVGDTFLNSDGVT